jgi:chromosome partitioning protein
MNHEDMTVYTFANLKGGSGKTTSAVSIAEALAREGHNVLAVDLDPQGSLSRWLVSRSDAVTSLLRGNADGVSIQTADLGGAPGRIDVLAADRSLVEFDDMRATKISRLLERMWGVSEGYDYGIVDPPPSVGALAIAALMASDSILSPVEAGPGALDGLKDTIELISETDAGSLTGAFACRVDRRTTLDESIRKGLIQEFGTVDSGGQAFRTQIREAVALREARTAWKPPGLYEPGMTTVSDYADLTAELLNLETQNHE